MNIHLRSKHSEAGRDVVAPLDAASRVAEKTSLYEFVSRCGAGHYGILVNQGLSRGCLRFTYHREAKRLPKLQGVCDLDDIDVSGAWSSERRLRR
jgi:hypothetical protein